MKKYTLKITALVLCICMLSVSLCGCSLLERFGISLPELPFLQKEETASYVLPGPTDFYTEPSWDAQIVATYYEGYTVTYSTMVTLDGVTWAQAEEGWFAIDGTKPADILNSYLVTEVAFATEDLVIYEKPSVRSAQLDRLRAGSPVTLREIAETTEGEWGRCDFGWMQMSSMYIDGQIGVHHGFGVSRNETVSFYSNPGVQSQVSTASGTDTRFEILEQINIDGYWWGCTEAGWVSMDSIYVEGTTGLRPCTAMVIDPTPLNVRVGPGTDFGKITTLSYGDYVEILERVERNGNDWGYTGEGWIFMDLTQVQ